ncbi:MAG: tRNA (adenosine(37)-N6)-threonylcarbamoyltransferase complex transferase subunit TsaD [Armatimonadota bacterium]|nr:tRNA (adenosine(37)-N6)-threonylcarbamoyltransferase complex transferase subunit TsaD [bacterium]
MKILGIETSCDETSAAVVADGVSVLSNVIASQVEIHARFGGVVPEVASRRHVELIMPTIQEALDKAGCALHDIDCIGVINRPGLIGALIVGVAAAKTIAYAAKIPLVAVHHIEAHIYANWLTAADIQFPLICLVVSGGHSDLIYMSDHGKYEILARTRDDAAGECFDKCARAIGLGYPGGPEIDRLAKEGNSHSVKFPRAKVGDTLDFSFSGLKTAVIRYIEGFAERPPLPDLAASFQAAIVDVLVDHTFKAAQERGVKLVMMAGGVAANSSLQAAMKARGKELGIVVNAPPPVLCTDNAAMTAAAAYFAQERGLYAGLDLDSFASQPIGERAEAM